MTFPEINFETGIFENLNSAMVFCHVWEGLVVFDSRDYENMSVNPSEHGGQHARLSSHLRQVLAVLYPGQLPHGTFLH